MTKFSASHTHFLAQQSGKSHYQRWLKLIPQGVGKKTLLSATKIHLSTTYNYTGLPKGGPAVFLEAL